MKHNLYIVDVFAENIYQGNQLAVIFSRKVEAGSLKLPDSEMQHIANEMHFSETTFITGKGNYNSWNVRIFTPQMEVPFAGHPTLGTAYIIQSELIKSPVKSVTLNYKVGRVPVSFTYEKDKSEVLWMKQPEPQFGVVLDADSICRTLKINKEDIDERFPVQEVSTGLPSVIIPLKELVFLTNFHLSAENYFKLVNKTEAKSVFLFCPQTLDKRNDFHVRDFGYYFGIPEDPATGSANGCLAAYLVKYRYCGKPEVNARVEQGNEIGRPSLLFLRAREKDNKIKVEVGGKVVLVAKGELES